MPAKVIVVHDEPDIREAALKALRAAGHDCVGFRDPMAALDAIDHNGRLRILVSRVNFGPGKLTGTALARMVHVKRPGTMAIIVAAPEFQEEAGRSGDMVLIAPLDPMALVDAVASLDSAGVSA